MIAATTTPAITARNVNSFASAGFGMTPGSSVFSDTAETYHSYPLRQSRAADTHLDVSLVRRIVVAVAGARARHVGVERTAADRARSGRRQVRTTVTVGDRVRILPRVENLLPQVSGEI